jgi:protein-tyrosine phosphatase
VSQLPNDAFWVYEGTLMAGPYPGSKNAKEAMAKLEALVSAGAHDFLDLTEPGELEPYEDLLPDEASGKPTYQRFPIQDVNIPTEEVMRGALAAVRASLSAGRVPYVHCWGGVGRTGTLVGCLLREDGVSDDKVFTEIARLRVGTERADRKAP